MLPLPKVLLLGICTLSSVMNWNLSLSAGIQWDGFNSLFFMNISWWEASLRCPLLQIYNFDYLFFFAFLLAYLWPKTKLDGISNYINCRFFPQKDVGHKALERLDGESWAKSQSSVLTLKVHSHCCCCCYDNYLSNDCLQGPLLTFLPQMSCFDTSGEKIWLTSCILKLTILLLMATLRCFDFLGSQRQQSFSYCGDDLPAWQKVVLLHVCKAYSKLKLLWPQFRGEKAEAQKTLWYTKGATGRWHQNANPKLTFRPHSYVIHGAVCKGRSLVHTVVEKVGMREPWNRGPTWPPESEKHYPQLLKGFLWDSFA